MSGAFSKPKSPELPRVEETEPVTAIAEDEETVKKRKRAFLANSGRSQNLMAGMNAVLKQRLGE